MKKGIFSIIGTLCASLVLSFATSFKTAVPVLAEGENSVTVETNQEVEKGSTYYAYVYIDSLENVASLNVSVHYDSNALYVNYTHNQVSCALYDSSIKDETITYSYIFNAGGETYKTSLFYFSYSISNETDLERSFFDIVIDEAYDSSLNSVSIKGSRKYFDINERQTATQYCYIYGNSSVNSKKEEEFELSYSFSTTSIASGTFEIQYDRELFEFVSLTQLGFFDGKLVDINSSLEGAISLSFVGTTYANRADLFRIKFKTIANENATSQIKLIASTFYNLNLEQIVFNGYETTVNLAYDSNYDETLAKMFLTSNYDEANNQVKALVKLSSNSNLGAGDFVLSWAKNYLSYSNSTKKFNPSFFNINDKQTADGILKFSIISLTDITEESDIIEIVFGVINPHDDTSVTLEITGSGLADSLTNPIYLNFVDCSQTIPGKCTYGEWSTAKAPTCTEPGSEHRVCSVCGREETRVIPANGHDWEEEWTIDVEPTCTSEGSKSHHCKNCDAKNDVTVIAKTEHQAADPVRENEIAATCTTDGSYDEVIYCKDCHTELSRTHKTISATGHTYGEWSTTKEPTCTETGFEHRVCSVCGHEETREIAAAGHSYSDEWTIDVEPTCTSEGSKSHHCTKCGDKKDITTIPKTEHKPGTPVKENNVDPTCTESGSYDLVTYCSDCGEKLSTEHIVVDATGHSYNDWSTVKAPTCTEPGSEHRVCSVCGREETRVIPANGHDWEEEWTIDVEPTCTSEGSKSHHCKNCDAKNDVTVIEKTEHRPADPVKENAVKETCTTDGSYDEVVYCQDCHTELSRTHKTVPATNSCQPDTKEKKGCGGSIYATGFALTAVSCLTVSLMFFRKKKRT